MKHVTQCIAMVVALSPAIASAPPQPHGTGCFELETECNAAECGGFGITTCQMWVASSSGVRIVDFVLEHMICDHYPNTISWSGDDCDNAPPGWSVIGGCEAELGEGNCCIGENDESIELLTPVIIMRPTLTRSCTMIAVGSQ